SINRQMSELENISGRGNSHRGHSARLYDQQQSPAVQESNRWMISLAQVSVLASDEIWSLRSQLGINESASQGHETSKEPAGEDERHSVNASRHDVGIHEDTGANDAAHHNHSRVKQT